MAEFDPGTVLQALALLAGNRVKFVKEWKASTEKRLKTWIRGHPEELRKDPQLIRQLDWEANVVEYVTYVHTESRNHGNSKALTPKLLPKGIPIFGPRFVPPTFLEAKKRNPTSIQPAVQYMRPLNVVHPFYYDGIGKCPQCGSTEIAWDGWTGAGSREVHGLRLEEKAIGFQLRCEPCKDKYGAGGSDVGAKNEEGEKLIYSFATTNTKFWDAWQHWEIPRGIPYFFYRCALTRDLFDLIVEIRPSTTSGKLAENIKQLHLLEYKQRHLEYLRAFEARTVPGIGDPSPLTAFSAHNDSTGYNGKSITDDLITDVFLEFCNRTRIEECSRYLRTLTAICLNLDNTFKAANKATVVDDSKAHTRVMKGGILSVLNELNQIISWRFCQSGSASEIVELLQGLKTRLDALGVPYPEMVTVDNCCHVKTQILSVIPDIRVLLDVFHFLMRYAAVILNGTRNPHRGEVLKNIRDAIVKEPSSKDAPAKYWPQDEQKVRLAAAFEKWAVRGGVWSAAAQNVHSAQMQHVSKGCLARPRDDIASDGSRIEASHKGWNSLQRSFASGIGLQAALGHDFVLRRNIRVAFNGKHKSSDPFVLSTFGSHHLSLVDHTAASWNGILGTLAKGSSFVPLPQLKNVESGETFGIVNSPSTDTYGGLYTIKPEPEDDMEVINELDPKEQQDLVHELNLDPALFLEPMARSGQLPESNIAKMPSDKPSDIPAADRKNIDNINDSSEPDVGHPIATPSSGTKRKENPAAEADLAPETAREGPETKRVKVQQPTQFYSLFASQAVPSTTNDAAPKPAPLTSSTNLSLSELNAPLPQPIDGTVSGKLTPSQRLFATATGVDPRALKIGKGSEFFLFMNMRKEFQWKSFEMTPKRWVEATMAYNSRRQAAGGNTGIPVIKKHPRALLEKMAEIEPQILRRISANDFKSAKGSTKFWEEHCSAVSFVKIEAIPSNIDLVTIQRRQQTCARCLTIKYPGPTGSDENHKKIYCSDGFKTKLASEAAAPWPQPNGIFTKGAEFHPFVFLAEVREVYGRLFTDSVKPEDLSLEHDALLKLLNTRLVVDDSTGNVMFKMFPDFAIPAKDNIPDYLIVEYNASKHLLINSLKSN
ncbi:hypothetical protein C8R47DRAFT_1226202 [Mycena vitilis]|nr:hypothetical protein C8R47DRAFT_1226202 [Mycena vitilis]